MGGLRRRNLPGRKERVGESGKTAFLQALQKISPVDETDGKFDMVMDYPRNTREKAAVSSGVVRIQSWWLFSSVGLPSADSIRP